MPRMDLKRLITHFAYKIEPKPEGGFIARPFDPSVATLEAPTREELQQKIRQNMATFLSTEFPNLKLPREGQNVDLSFHVEHTPDGGFSIHSADPNAPVIQTEGQKDLESKLVEKFLGFAGKHLMPELSQALASQAGSADIDVTGKTVFRVNTNPEGLTFGAPRTESAQVPKLMDSTTDLAKLNATIGNNPITPESSNSWKIFGFLLLLAMMGGLIYLYLVNR